MKLQKIKIFSFSIAISIFLALLFILEELLTPLQNLNFIVWGFASALAATLLSIFFYNTNKFKLKFYFNKNIKTNIIIIKKISIIKFSLVVALYEASIFLVMFLTRNLFPNTLQGNILFGLIAGFFGAIIATLIYNTICLKFDGVEFRIK